MNDDNTRLPQPGEAPREWAAYGWYPVIGGLAAVAVAAALGFAGLGETPGFGLYLRVALAAAGMLALGVAIWLRPAHVGTLALACLAGVVARFGFPESWDSGRMLAGVGSVVAGVAAVLMALPRPYRRLGVMVLVLLHFGNMVVASTGPGTGGAPPPWITQVLHTYVYRDYAEFVYLKNAYHFYSPEPGPASQVWFCLYYGVRDPKTGELLTDPVSGEPKTGDSMWFKLPRRPDDIQDPLALSYYRRLSLTMQLENYARVPTVPPEVLLRRNARATGRDAIPWHQEIPRDQQWRPPGDPVRMFFLPSFVKHVAHMPKNQHPDGVTPVVAVKVYHVEHRVVMPYAIKYVDPYDPILYSPYFVGEFTADGKPIHTDDPMLYWLCPIQYLPKNVAVEPWHNFRTHPHEFDLVDGVNIHTNSDHTDPKKR